MSARFSAYSEGRHSVPYADIGIRDHIGVIGEFLLADRALAMLEGDLPVHQLPHFAIRAQFPVAARMMRVFDPAESHLLCGSLLRNRFPATAESGMVYRAKLVATESHRVPLRDGNLGKRLVNPSETGLRVRLRPKIDGGSIDTASQWTLQRKWKRSSTWSSRINRRRFPAMLKK